VLGISTKAGESLWFGCRSSQDNHFFPPAFPLPDLVACDALLPFRPPPLRKQSHQTHQLSFLTRVAQTSQRPPPLRPLLSPATPPSFLDASTLITHSPYSALHRLLKCPTTTDLSFQPLFSSPPLSFFFFIHPTGSLTMIFSSSARFSHKRRSSSQFDTFAPLLCFSSSPDHCQTFSLKNPEALFAPLSTFP